MRIAALLALVSTLSYGATDSATPNKTAPASTKKTTKSKTAPKSSAHSKPAAKSGSKTTAKGKPTARNGKSASVKGKTSKTAAKRGKNSRAKTAQTWRSRQLSPTPDRYKEIQSALAQRGYLKKDPTGVWDNDSTDAMRKFQQDQNLEATGKLDSLSLMALGLGAKHENPPAAAPAAITPPAPVETHPVSAPPELPAAVPLTPAPVTPADPGPQR